MTKDPDEILDYTVDWSERLETDETISTSSWIVDSGLTVDSDSKSSTAATVWLSGGTSGQFYAVINRITTSVNRTYEQAFHLRCLDSQLQDQD
jgi:hypothetical protein